jgi:hypothetical protein
MPKPLGEWVDDAIQRWWMPVQAHRLRWGGWHKGSLGGWSDCGKAWLVRSSVAESVGWGKKTRNPWAAGAITDGRLCKQCFAAEIPWLSHRLKPTDMLSRVPITFDEIPSGYPDHHRPPPTSTKEP